MVGRPGNEAIQNIQGISTFSTDYVYWLFDLLHLICYILIQCMSVSLAYIVSIILHGQNNATQVNQSLPSIPACLKLALFPSSHLSALQVMESENHPNEAMLNLCISFSNKATTQMQVLATLSDHHKKD